MIEIKYSEYKGSDVLEIWRDGRRAVGFGKGKAQAIMEATRDPEALKELEKFSGYARADLEAKTQAAEAQDRNRFDSAYCAAGMGEESC